MLYVYRFRLYPKKGQIEFLNRQIGHCRFVYNKLLEIAKKDYEAEGKKWNYYEYKKLLPKLKEEFPFLKEANSQSLQEAVKWLDRAFKNFFKGIAKFPKFKSKKRINSVSIPQHFCIGDLPEKLCNYSITSSDSNLTLIN
jgi:putative transposase